MGGTLNRHPIVALVPATIGSRSSTGTSSNADGTWSEEQNPGGQLRGDPIAILVAGAEALRVCYRATDNGVWSRWRTLNGSRSTDHNLGG